MTFSQLAVRILRYFCVHGVVLFVNEHEPSPHIQNLPHSYLYDQKIPIYNTIFDVLFPVLWMCILFDCISIYVPYIERGVWCIHNKGRQCVPSTDVSSIRLCNFDALKQFFWPCYTRPQHASIRPAGHGPSWERQINVLLRHSKARGDLQAKWYVVIICFQPRRLGEGKRKMYFQVFTTANCNFLKCLILCQFSSSCESGSCCGVLRLWCGRRHPRFDFPRGCHGRRRSQIWAQWGTCILHGVLRSGSHFVFHFLINRNPNVFPVIWRHL